MRRLFVKIDDFIPSAEQVLWRAGCPAHRAGESLENAAALALETLKDQAGNARWGALLFQPEQAPPFIAGMHPHRSVTVMAATLGIEVDRLISGAPGLSVFMLDSAASVAVELLVKRLQAGIGRLLGMVPTARSAPGYGGFPISYQREIIDMFPMLGITCGDGYLLSPLKSMTGVTGWIPPEG